MSGPMFKRANYVVADLDRSLALYRDVLGFSIDYTKDSKKDSYSYPVFKFPPEATLRFCTLSSPSQERCFAITEVTGIELPPQPEPRLHAIVVNIPGDFDAVVEGVNALGTCTVREEGELKDLDGNVKGREWGFEDPDGHLVVLYKLLDQ